MKIACVHFANDHNLRPTANTDLLLHTQGPQ